LPRRLINHAALAAGSLIILGISLWLDAGEATRHQLSFATAWICLIYMGIALSIGPLMARSRDTVPLNIYLRRDVGIWCALAGLAHFFLGVDQSMNQVYLARFVTSEGGLVTATVADQLFTWGSIIGLVAAVVILVPFCLSSDFMLRRLGPTRWKSLQKTAIWAFALTLVHGLAFQLLESRSVVLIALLLAACLAVMLLRFRTRSSAGNATDFDT
jgi:DMSO/TMAO reductase YedYZ heme-binding membrane subunit